MSRFSRVTLIALASFVVIFIAAIPASAHASLSPLVKSINPVTRLELRCSHLLVHLNGKRTPLTKCLDHQKPNAKPFTYVTDCGAHTLFISQDYYGGGATICFIGSGFANMTDYWGPWYNHFNWNDQASYYAPGCSGGDFFADINGQGMRQSFVPYEYHHNFDGGTSFSGQRVLNNDTLSSLSLSSNCS